MKPNNYRPRKGDVVMVPAVVKFDCDPEDDAVHITIGGYTSARIPVADIGSVTRRTWEPRDRVQSLASTLDRGIVAAVAGKHVWVKLEPSGVYRTFDDIGLTDDDTVEPEAPPAPAPVFVERPRSREVLSGCAVRAVIQQEPEDVEETKF